MQVGSFPNWDVWAEWNGKYRDDVRRFIKGDMGKLWEYYSIASVFKYAALSHHPRFFRKCKPITSQTN
jgi:hypothetical protein